MPFISSRSRNRADLNLDVIEAQQHPTSQQALTSGTGNTETSRVSRASNHRLQPISAQALDKVDRRAVKAIVKDYKKLQSTGFKRGDETSTAEARNAYVTALTDTQTRLVQLSAKGLSDQTPPFSKSQRVKNNLVLAGGAASKVGQYGVVGATIVGSGLGVATVTGATLVSRP